MLTFAYRAGDVIEDIVLHCVIMINPDREFRIELVSRLQIRQGTAPIDMKPCRIIFKQSVS